MYLFNAKSKRVYLSLNQGATGVKDIHKSNAKGVLELQAKNYQFSLNIQNKRLVTGPIDLGATPTNSLSPYYEKGAIYSFKYESGAIPNDELLIDDLHYLMRLYTSLYIKESTFTQSMTINNEDDGYMDEDLTKFRMHKSVERPSGIAKKVKEVQGYVCKGCDVDYVARYGEKGKSCIDAHHLTPVKDTKGEKLRTHVEKDYVVLCANCHRLIHRLENTADIDALRKIVYST